MTFFLDKRKHCNFFFILNLFPLHLPMITFTHPPPHSHYSSMIAPTSIEEEKR